MWGGYRPPPTPDPPAGHDHTLAVPPNVTTSSSAAGPVVEGRDSVTLSCAADANPEAELAWRKEGEGRVLGNFPTLDIGVVSRTGVAIVCFCDSSGYRLFL